MNDKATVIDVRNFNEGSLTRPTDVAKNGVVEGEHNRIRVHADEGIVTIT